MNDETIDISSIAAEARNVTDCAMTMFFAGSLLAEYRAEMAVDTAPFSVERFQNCLPGWQDGWQKWVRTNPLVVADDPLSAFRAGFIDARR